jgi:hypothetical protein
MRHTLTVHAPGETICEVCRERKPGSFFRGIGMANVLTCASCAGREEPVPESLSRERYDKACRARALRFAGIEKDEDADLLSELYNLSAGIPSPKPEGGGSIRG